MRFFDINNGVALGQFAFYYTRDGGRTWKVPKFPAGCVGADFLDETHEGRAVSVAMLDSNTFWLAFDDGRMMRSENGGRTWCDLVQPGTVPFDEMGPRHFQR